MRSSHHTKQKPKDGFKDSVKDLQKFKLAVDNAYDHIIMTDTEGIVLYANKAAEKITGFSKAEIIGTKAGALWGGLMDKSFYKKLWRTIKINKKSFSGEIRNRRKNGEEYIALSSIAPVLDKNENVEFFVGIERDITREKMAEKAKNEFVSIASHQLRTPVTSIQWLIELILKKEKLSKKGREYLKDAYIATSRLSGLVDTLLNLSRIESGSVSLVSEPIELVKFIRRMVKETEMMGAKKKIKFTFKDYPKELNIKSDFYALSNIFQTILTNTVEYTPDKGRVSIVLEKRKNTFFCSISDTGIGIPKEDQARIFGQFVRGGNAHLQKSAGVGIGLYVAKQATELLGGKIWFESIEGKGTTFYIELPLKSRSVKGEKQLT